MQQLQLYNQNNYATSSSKFYIWRRTLLKGGLSASLFYLDRFIALFVMNRDVPPWMIALIL